jgi:hypothetical protein
MSGNTGFLKILLSYWKIASSIYGVKYNTLKRFSELRDQMYRLLLAKTIEFARL